MRLDVVVDQIGCTVIGLGRPIFYWYFGTTHGEWIDTRRMLEAVGAYLSRTITLRRGLWLSRRAEITMVIATSLAGGDAQIIGPINVLGV